MCVCVRVSLKKFGFTHRHRPDATTHSLVLCVSRFFSSSPFPRQRLVGEGRKYEHDGGRVICREGERINK